MHRIHSVSAENNIKLNCLLLQFHFYSVVDILFCFGTFIILIYIELEGRFLRNAEQST